MISYDENICRTTGLSPVAVMAANAILYFRLLGNDKPTINDITDHLAFPSTSTITTAIKELRANGVMDMDSYDLSEYVKIVTERNTGLTTKAMEVANEIIRFFNRVAGSAYQEDDNNIAALIARCIKDQRSKDTLKDKDVFQTFLARAKAVIAHKNETWEKKYVTPTVIFRNPNRFYKYVTEARSYWRVKDKATIKKIVE